MSSLTISVKWRFSPAYRLDSSMKALPWIPSPVWTFHPFTGGLACRHGSQIGFDQILLGTDRSINRQHPRGIEMVQKVPCCGQRKRIYRNPRPSKVLNSKEASKSMLILSQTLPARGRVIDRIRSIIHDDFPLSPVRYTALEVSGQPPGCTWIKNLQRLTSSLITYPTRCTIE
jgi:hypothetical protein